MSRYDILLEQDATSPPAAEAGSGVTAQPASPARTPRARRDSKPQMADQPISRPLQQSPDRSTRQSTKGATKRSSKIVERPKAFYITQELDRRLDEAVRYYQEVHGIKKADRSSIVNAMMDNDANWTEEALYLLLDRIISQLTSRLTN